MLELVITCVSKRDSGGTMLVFIPLRIAVASGMSAAGAKEIDAALTCAIQATAMGRARRGACAEAFLVAGDALLTQGTADFLTQGTAAAFPQGQTHG